MDATLRLMFGVEAEMDQGVVLFAAAHQDVATMAAIAAAGTSARYKLFPAKGHAAIAAVPSLDSDSCFINKHATFKFSGFQPVMYGKRDFLRFGIILARNTLAAARAAPILRDYRDTQAH